MDPISAIGIAAGAMQFADFSGRVIIEGLSVLRSLKHDPEKIKELLQDLEWSIERIAALQNAMTQPSSALSQLSVLGVACIDVSSLNSQFRLIE